MCVYKHFAYSVNLPSEEIFLIQDVQWYHYEDTFDISVNPKDTIKVFNNQYIHKHGTTKFGSEFWKDPYCAVVRWKEMVDF